MPDSTQGESDAPDLGKPFAGIPKRSSKADRWDVHDKQVKDDEAESK
jgi:hypothetical protein